MEENTNSSFFSFDSPKGQSSYIKVIGVGGGGGNAVNHMFHQGIEGVDFIVCNTDMKALNASPVPNKISLGDLGAGNKPERARKAAMDKADDIREAISRNTKMLFITAGMGGGTGTGAAPVIAEIAKSIDLDSEDTKKILVVAIVTQPFSFEGKRRREQAQAGIAELRKYVDSIIVINNDKLRTFGDLDISEAFGMADDVLLTAAKGIAEIITVTATLNIDFQDVNTVMEQSGTALMGAGSGKGENRALQAIEEATTSVLLDDSDIRGAKNVLLYFSYSADHKIKMDEIGIITDFISDKTDGTADVIWGAGTDDSLDDELKVTLIATGFEKQQGVNTEPVVIELPVDEEEPKAKPQVVEQPKATDEPELIHKPEPEPVVMKEEPVVAVAPQPQAVAEPSRAGLHVIPLDDEPAMAEDALLQPNAGLAQEHDAMVEEIRMVKNEPIAEPVQKVAPVASRPSPVQTEAAPAPSTFDKDADVTTAAERIRRIHELLRNNSNGAEIVQSMSTRQMADEALFEGAHSSVREASSMSMRADGSIGSNPYVYGPQPD